MYEKKNVQIGPNSHIKTMSKRIVTTQASHDIPGHTKGTI